MKCKHCKKPIILVPSAAERNRKNIEQGREKVNYAEIFQYHNECQLEMRKQGTKDLMDRINAEYNARQLEKRLVKF
jgi:hypothetical protein